MRAMTTAVAAVLLAAGASRSEDGPKPPAPAKENEWLGQLVGQWQTEAEMVMAPGQPPVKSTGTETVRSLGGFWLVSEMKGECLGTPVTGVMTVGYDPRAKKYVGTWVCSMCDHMCKYEGTVDAAGKVLTLETDGPDPATGKLVRMRDVVELKDKDLRVMTSSALGADGKWVPFMTLTARRAK